MSICIDCAKKTCEYRQIIDVCLEDLIKERDHLREENVRKDYALREKDLEINGLRKAVEENDLFQYTDTAQVSTIPKMMNECFSDCPHGDVEAELVRLKADFSYALETSSKYVKENQRLWAALERCREWFLYDGDGRNKKPVDMAQMCSDALEDGEIMPSIETKCPWCGGPALASSTGYLTCLRKCGRGPRG